MGIHITCKQAVDYISKKEENKLSVLQTVKLRYHLAICSLCKIFSQQNALIIKAFKNIEAQEEFVLPEEKKEEIVEAVLNEKN